MVSIFNFNFLLGRIDVWMDEWMDKQIYVYMHSNSNIYINKRIDIYTNAPIYRRIYRHRMCEYIDPSIHIWTSRTLNQSPANAQIHDNGASIRAKIMCGRQPCK